MHSLTQELGIKTAQNSIGTHPLSITDTGEVSTQLFLCVSPDTDQKSCRPQVTQSCLYLCFDCPRFSVVMKLPMQTLLTHSFLPPTLLLSFNYIKSCQEAGSSCKDGVGGLSRSSPQQLEALFVFQMRSWSVHVPSRSSFSKLVPCWLRIPPRSTTASSSLLCWTRTNTFSTL